jgi:hypothetical protein
MDQNLFVMIFLNIFFQIFLLKFQILDPFLVFQVKVVVEFLHFQEKNILLNFLKNLNFIIIK